MSALTLESTVAERPAGWAPVDAPRRGGSAPARPSRGTGRRTAPPARPGRPVEAPTLRRPAAARVRACAAAPAAPTSTAAWRLTDRGIAVILTAAVMIAFAALTVIGLTALRVTSPTYQPIGHSQLIQP